MRPCRSFLSYRPQLGALAIAGALATPHLASAQALPPGTPTHVPPPQATAEQQAREEAAIEQQVRTEAEQQRPQMEREAAAELDRKRREAWLATGPEVHYNSFPRSKSLVVVGVDLAVGFGAVKPTLHPSGLRARVELPLSDVITLFGTAGVQRSSFQQGAAARLDPAFSLGIGRTLQQEGSRVAFGGGAELVAFAHRVAPEQPSATLFPFVNLAASFCTFRYAVGQSKGCLAVGFEARLGVYIPFGGEEGGDGFRATSGGAARRVQGMGQFGLGPSFQF